jgi:hypothetical protein
MSDGANGNQPNPETATPSQREANGTAERNYDIGYAKAPVATRFKKGQSGNPKGRKKKQAIDDVRVVIEGVLGEPIKIRSGGQVRTVSKLEAMLQTQLASALGGDPKAALAVFKLGRKAGLFSQAKPTNHMIIYPPGTDEERMILKAFHAEPGTNEESADEPDDGPIGPRH